MARSRAFRRHHHKRMVERVKRFDWIKSFKAYYTPEELDQFVKHLAETRHPCSCYMCGNARKMWKQKTMQEIKMDIKEHDWDDFVE